MMKILTEILMVACLVLAMALPAMGKSKTEGHLSFSGKSMPQVDFAHDAHKEYVDDCKACHHFGVGTGTCVDCHGGDNRARPKKKAFHDSCQGCHSKKQVSDPKNCQFCHKG